MKNPLGVFPHLRALVDLGPPICHLYGAPSKGQTKGRKRINKEWSEEIDKISMEHRVGTVLLQMQLGLPSDEGEEKNEKLCSEELLEIKANIIRGEETAQVRTMVTLPEGQTNAEIDPQEERKGVLRKALVERYRDTVIRNELYHDPHVEDHMVWPTYH